MESSGFLPVASDPTKSEASLYGPAQIQPGGRGSRRDNSTYPGDLVQVDFLQVKEMIQKERGSWECLWFR